MSRYAVMFSAISNACTHFAIDLNGIPMVVDALKQFPSDSAIQRRCCLLLALLGNHDGPRPAIQKAKLSTLVGNALDNHNEDAKLVEAVKDFFDTMCRRADI